MPWVLMLFLCANIGCSIAQICDRTASDYLYPDDASNTIAAIDPQAETAAIDLGDQGLKSVVFGNEYTILSVSSLGLLSWNLPIATTIFLDCAGDPPTISIGITSIPIIVAYYQEYFQDCLGQISYQLHTDDSDGVFTRASTEVASFFSDSGFTPTYVLVATWKNVFVGQTGCGMGADSNGGDTFQVILIADDEKTYVLRKYKSLQSSSTAVLNGIYTASPEVPGFAEDTACTANSNTIAEFSNVNCEGTYAQRMFVPETCEAPALNLDHMSVSETGEGATEGSSIILTCDDGYQLVTGVDADGDFIFGGFELILTCNGESWDDYYTVGEVGLGCAYTGGCAIGRVLSCDRCDGESVAECDMDSVITVLSSTSSSSSGIIKRRKKSKKKSSKSKNTRSKRSAGSSDASTNSDDQLRCITTFHLKKNGDQRVKKRSGYIDDCVGAKAEGECDFDTMASNSKCFECSPPTCQDAPS